MKRSGLVVAALFAVVVVVPGVGAKSKVSDAPIVAGELGRQLEAAVAKAGGPGFWGAVLVAKDGEILLAKGYGSADYGKTPNTPLTLFELASASKQIAAAAILHLRQRKKLEVTDSIGRFFKDLPEDKKAVTVHHLLTHTAGLSGRIGVPYASTIGRPAYIKSMLAKPLVAKPGEKFAYSNVGYALLAAIVEEVTGKTFEEYCERNLFRPAKMTDTGFINDRDLIRTGRASTRKTKEPGAWTAAKWHWGWGYKGMGGVVTTVHDMNRWDRALRDDRVLSEESKKLLFTPAQRGYAYGWKIDTTARGTRKAHHSGGVAGYGVNVVRYLEEDGFICVLGNDGRKAFAITAAVESLLFPPVRLAATIDVKPYELGNPPILKLPKDVTWRASGDGKAFRLSLRQGRHTVVEIRTPPGHAARLIDMLTRAIAARKAEDDGSPAATEASLYLQPYPSLFPRFTLTEKLTLEVNPEYRHRDGVDKRVHLVLKDGHYGQWPMMALLNVAAARELLAAIRKAVE